MIVYEPLFPGFQSFSESFWPSTISTTHLKVGELRELLAPSSDKSSTNHVTYQELNAKNL